MCANMRWMYSEAYEFEVLEVRIWLLCSTLRIRVLRTETLPKPLSFWESHHASCTLNVDEGDQSVAAEHVKRFTVSLSHSHAHTHTNPTQVEKLEYQMCVMYVCEE